MGFVGIFRRLAMGIPRHQVNKKTPYRHAGFDPVCREGVFYMVDKMCPVLPAQQKN